MVKRKPVKKTSERKEGWMRIVVAIVSGIVLDLWSIFITVLALLNWIVTVISGKRSKDMAMLCEYWNTETYRFIRYLTFVSNERPFPFNHVQRISKFSK